MDMNKFVMVRNVYKSNLPVHFMAKKLCFKGSRDKTFLTMKSSGKFLQSKILTIKYSGYSEV